MWPQYLNILFLNIGNSAPSEFETDKAPSQTERFYIFHPTAGRFTSHGTFVFALRSFNRKGSEAHSKSWMDKVR